MRYHCQCYRDARKCAEFTAPQLKKLRASAADYLTEVSVSPSASPAAYTGRPQDVLSIVRSDGAIVARAGLLGNAELAKEAFFTIEALDLNECLRMVSGFPLLCIGSIEIRPG